MKFRFKKNLVSTGRVFWFQVPEGFSCADAWIQIRRFEKFKTRRPSVFFLPDSDPGLFAGKISRWLDQRILTGNRYVFSHQSIHSFVGSRVNFLAIENAIDSGSLVCLKIRNLGKSSATELDFWFHSILEQEAKRLNSRVFRITSGVAEFVEVANWKNDRSDLRIWIADRITKMSENTLSLDHEASLSKPG